MSCRAVANSSGLCACRDVREAGRTVRTGSTRLEANV